MTTSYSTLYKSLIQASKKSHFNKGTWALMASALACVPAVAAETELATQDDMPVAYFPKITVTATRTPTAVNNTIAQTRVIDSEELNTYKGQSALDVIKRQPGFTYKQNGGMGTTSNFYLRGYDNKSILVLIDGVRYSSLSAGGASLNLLPADQIDRIEVLYGASGTSMYGADAVGGVIQIFTKGANVDESSFSVTAGAGNNDHYLYGASAQIRNDNGTSLSLSASHNETKGHNATLVGFLPNGKLANNTDDDGFKSDNYSLRLNQKINKDLDFSITGLYSESETEFDSGSSSAIGKDYTKSRQKNGAAQAFANWRYASNSNIKLTYGHSIDESDTPTEPSLFKTKQDQFSLVGQHQLPLGIGIYGAEYLSQKLDGYMNIYPEPDYIPTKFDYNPKDRKVTSGFLGYLMSYNNIDIQANVRHDNYSDFDDKTTYNLGVAYHFTPEFRSGINYAKGYRVPTFNDLYYPEYDNPDLSPETSNNYEAFLDYSTGLQSTRLTGYYNKVDNFILSEAPTYIPENIYKAKIKGVTLSSDWNIDNYLIGFSYDYQKAEDDSGKGNDGNYLPNRPKNKGTIYLGYQLPDLNIRAEYEYVDDFYGNIENTNKLDSYNLVNLSGNYQLTPALSMSARLNNVFNEKYVTSTGYSTDDGTNFFTSLTYTWK
ncbi:Vitamin B12 transporter BtuB precursor [Psychrobacter pasteurii]|uniref:Vitamin B12 transporter BtuB n=1 Tax=Psychrobacter pasteurii TaxID=1945520 RepID=A0A1R4EIY9_9GAMM|nr:TonB-dependent receptor [Psychrobacter pasteurii]SJM38440.1 Vitamin B12 transporter BtuB precursor [Psychrobacter pasteurii]